MTKAKTDTTELVPHKRQGKHGTYLNLYPKSGYDPTVYERPVLTVDVCIFRFNPDTLGCNSTLDAMQVLLIKRGQAPFKGRWAFPGGYVNISDGEDIYTAALRELHEETGVENLKSKLMQEGTYASYERDPRWYTVDVVYTYMAGPEEGKLIQPKAGDDAAKAVWVSVKTAMKRKLAFDHNKILGNIVHPTSLT